jgi:acyl-CoA-binding protein
VLMEKKIDRVFSHALNTVNKIRTGSQKPPSATRLRLYGLYKQAMGTSGFEEVAEDAERQEKG